MEKANDTKRKRLRGLLVFWAIFYLFYHTSRPYLSDDFYLYSSVFAILIMMILTPILMALGWSYLYSVRLAKRRPEAIGTPAIARLVSMALVGLLTAYYLVGSLLYMPIHDDLISRHGKTIEAGITECSKAKNYSCNYRFEVKGKYHYGSIGKGVITSCPLRKAIVSLCCIIPAILISIGASS